MNADELRSFVRRILERMDREPRDKLLDSLIARASKSSSGWKPSSPSRRVREEVNPRLVAPSVSELIGCARVAARIDARGHVAMLKRKYSRFPAFQRELDRALSEMSS